MKILGIREGTLKKLKNAFRHRFALSLSSVWALTSYFLLLTAAPCAAADLFPGYGGAMSAVSADADISMPQLLVSTPNLPVNGALVNVSSPGFSWVGLSTVTIAKIPGAVYTLQVDNNSDFSSPEVTDLTYHTVCEFDTFIVITGTRQIFVPGAELKVYPNPASGEFIQFELNGVDAGIYTLELFDAQGRLLTNRFFNHPNFQLIRHLLPEGLIFYRLAADGKPVASGKLILR